MQCYLDLFNKVKHQIAGAKIWNRERVKEIEKANESRNKKTNKHKIYKFFFHFSRRTKKKILLEKLLLVVAFSEGEKTVKWECKCYKSIISLCDAKKKGSQLFLDFFCSVLSIWQVFIKTLNIRTSNILSNRPKQ